RQMSQRKVQIVGRCAIEDFLRQPRGLGHAACPYCPDQDIQFRLWAADKASLPGNVSMKAQSRFAPILQTPRERSASLQRQKLLRSPQGDRRRPGSRALQADFAQMQLLRREIR